MGQNLEEGGGPPEIKEAFIRNLWGPKSGFYQNKRPDESNQLLDGSAPSHEEEVVSKGGVTWKTEPIKETENQL